MDNTNDVEIELEELDYEALESVVGGDGPPDISAIVSQIQDSFGG